MKDPFTLGTRSVHKISRSLSLYMCVCVKFINTRFGVLNIYSFLYMEFIDLSIIWFICHIIKGTMYISSS